MHKLHSVEKYLIQNDNKIGLTFFYHMFRLQKLIWSLFKLITVSYLEYDI